LALQINVAATVIAANDCEFIVILKLWEIAQSWGWDCGFGCRSEFCDRCGCCRLQFLFNP